MMKYSVNIPELRREMEANGFRTKRALARASDVSYRTVCSIMNGSVPAYTVICKIAKTLDLSEAEIGQVFFLCQS